MNVTLVHVYVKREYITAFIEATRLNHELSIKEPGNYRFDVLQSSSDPTHFVLYEAYRTQSHASAHKETTHYLCWRDTVAPMMAKDRNALKFIGIFPLDETINPIS